MANSFPSGDQSANWMSSRSRRGAPDPVELTRARVPALWNSPSTRLSRPAATSPEAEIASSVRARQAEGTRLRSPGRAHEDFDRFAVPRRAVENALAVGTEARGPDRSAPERELVVGGRVDARRFEARGRGGRRRRERRGARRRARGAGRRGRSASADVPAAAAAEPDLLGERLEIERDVVRGVESLLGALLEAVAHDALEARRDVLVRDREVRRVFLQDRRHRVRGRVAVEGAAAREHLVEDRAEGEDVAARVGGPAAHLLGRHVAERAQHDAGLGAGARGREVRHAEPRSSVCVSLARPKSRILTRPSLVTKTFSGFRSRWTMPFSCAAARPWTIWIE